MSLIAANLKCPHQRFGTKGPRSLGTCNTYAVSAVSVQSTEECHTAPPGRLHFRSNARNLFHYPLSLISPHPAMFASSLRSSIFQSSLFLSVFVLLYQQQTFACCEY
ncbi:hypothetical protein BaRGS_00037996, partial [Batillaria attramentaria]